MNKEKRKLLDTTFQTFMNVGLGQNNLDSLVDIVAKDVVGFGTAIDEKIFGINELGELLERQKKQSAGMDLSWKINTLDIHISTDENTAILTNEVTFHITIETETIEMYIRFSVVLEYVQDKWIVVHWHGSKPEHVESEKDTWGIETWKEKAEALEKEVAERTADLVEKNRDLQIEAALERVRAISLAMRHTLELQSVIHTVHQELLKLNISISGGSFIVINSEIDTELLCWGSGGTADTSDEVHIPYFDKPFYIHLLNGIKSGPGFFTEEYSQDEKIEFFTFLFQHEPWSKLGAKDKKETLSAPGGYTRSCAVSKHTSIFIINHFGEKFSEAENVILIRFGKVFEQSYTRFLDLQKAEAQALEAIKQTSLDRVRGEISSMRNANDLARITPLVFNELTTLGIPFIRCGVFIVHEKENHVEIYLSTPKGKSLAAMNLPFDANEMTAKAVEAWKNEEVYVQHWNKTDFVNFGKSLQEQGHITNLQKYQGSEMPPESIHLHFVPFAQGLLYVGSPETLAEEQIDLVKALSKSFAIAYARYEDFVKLEQAKAEVETAMSELKATQTQLVQQEKLASLGQLTAGIAHEIKNPLNFVNNFSEVSLELIGEALEELTIIKTRHVLSQKHALSSEHVLPPEHALFPDNAVSKDNESLEEINDILTDIQSNLARIHQHGTRANAIVSSMLQHSRGGTGKMEPTNLNSLIKEFINLAFHGMRAGKNPINVEMKFDLDEKLGEVNLIGEDFSRVVLNLANNALDAMREKSKIQADYKPVLSIRSKRKSETVQISVADNGPGIPEEIKNKILQPFFTTKKGREGTGLGLSITHDIIKAHGGEISIQTSEGVGSTFTIILPEEKCSLKTDFGE